MRAASRVYFMLLRLCGDRFVVHHELFRERLVTQYGFTGHSVALMPHPVYVPEEGRLVDVGVDLLGKLPRPYLVVPGYLADYKNPEVVLDAVESGVLRENVVFAMGANPRQRSREYGKRYNRLRQRAIALSNVVWLGFIDGDDVLMRLIEESRGVILPYLECVGASGIAAIAAGTGTPLFYSACLEPVCKGLGVAFGDTAVELGACLTGMDLIDVPTVGRLGEELGAAPTRLEEIWHSTLAALVGPGGIVPGLREAC